MHYKLNKKGFTLVELIAVLVILAIVTVIATTSFTAIKKKSLRKDSEALIRNLEIAAQKSAADRVLSSTTYLEIETDLVKKGYIEYSDKDKKQVIDPLTGKNLNSCEVIVTKDSNTNKYKAKFNYSEC